MYISYILDALLSNFWIEHLSIFIIGVVRFMKFKKSIEHLRLNNKCPPLFWNKVEERGYIRPTIYHGFKQAHGRGYIIH